MKNKVAVFLAHYGIGNSPSILNLLYALSRRYRVHLYIDHVELVSLPEPIDKRAVKIIAKNSLVSRALARFNEYRAVIAIDPHGFYLYDKTLGKKDNCFYYSLELYLKNDHFGLNYPTEVEECERQNIHTIKG